MKYAFINNKIGLATTIILFFYSCAKKDEVVNNPNVDMLISRQVSFENTNPNRKLVREFLYDNQDRCTEIRFGTIDSSSAATAVFVLSRKINFFYNGNEKNPVRAEYLRNPSFTTTQPYYFFYSSQNTKLKDSLVTGSSYRIANTLMPNNNTLVSTIFSTAIPPSYTVEVDTIYITNDNINRIKRKSGAGSSIPITNNIFTYDNKKNPFNTINIAQAFYFSHPDLLMQNSTYIHQQYEGLNRNYVLSVSQDGVNTNSIAYDYNSNNYPVKAMLNFVNSSTPYFITTYYTYKN